MRLSNIKTFNHNATGQEGQTLIETIVAIFVLVTALTAGVGLAIYAFAASSRGSSQIVATNLAREGIEVVRMMRDSNWLASDAKGAEWALTTCSDIGGRLCYPRSYSFIPSYNNFDLTPSAGNGRMEFNPIDGSWTLSGNGGYDLYLQSDGSYTHTVNGTSIYARMIDISFNTSAPYTNQNSNQEMIVKSIVAWRGKNCTDFVTGANLLTLNTPCKIVLEEHLTNWKDYR